MNVWKEIYEGNIAKEEKMLSILADEYNRIKKDENHKSIRKAKVKEIKEQCRKVRILKREYIKRLKKEGIK